MSHCRNSCYVAQNWRILVKPWRRVVKLLLVASSFSNHWRKPARTKPPSMLNVLTVNPQSCIFQGKQLLFCFTRYLLELIVDAVRNNATWMPVLQRSWTSNVLLWVISASFMSMNLSTPSPRTGLTAITRRKLPKSWSHCLTITNSVRITVGSRIGAFLSLRIRIDVI